MFCSQCGTPLKGDEIFCAECGAKVSTGASHVSQPVSSSHSSSLKDGYQQPSTTTPSPSPAASYPHQPSHPRPPPPYPSAPQVLPPNPYVMPQRKEAWIAVLLSFFVPGLGQIYAGKVSRGVGFLLLFFVGPIASFFLLFIPLLGFMASPTSMFGMIFMLLTVGSLVYVGLYVWCLIDAYQQVEKYNQFLMQHGRPPTSSDHW